MSGMTNGKITVKKRPIQAGATPLFDGPSAQKFRGIAPARHAGSVTVGTSESTVKAAEDFDPPGPPGGRSPK